MRTRAELDAIRASNRARLGLAGYSSVAGQARGLGFDPTAVLTGATVRLQTSFPEADLSWEPGATAPAEESVVSRFGGWILSHIIRPRGEVNFSGQTIAFDPYRDVPDYSQQAKVVAAIAGAGVAFGIAWTLVRAFWPTPRRLRRAR